MPKLPIIEGKKMLRFLEQRGFRVSRIRGSHFFLRNDEQKLATTVPIHGNEELRPGTLLGILEDIEMSKEEFCEQYAS